MTYEIAFCRYEVVGISGEGDKKYYLLQSLSEDYEVVYAKHLDKELHIGDTVKITKNLEIL